VTCPPAPTELIPLQAHAEFAHRASSSCHCTAPKEGFPFAHGGLEPTIYKNDIADLRADRLSSLARWLVQPGMLVAAENEVVHPCGPPLAQQSAGEHER